MQVVIFAFQTIASKMGHDISKLHLLFSNITLPALISLLKDIESVFVHIVESARLFMSCGLTNAAREEILFDIESSPWKSLMCREITISIENLVDNCKKVYTKVEDDSRFHFSKSVSSVRVAQVLFGTPASV